MQFRHRSESKMDERSYSCEATGGRDNPRLMEQFKGAVGSLQQHLMEQHKGGIIPFKCFNPPPPPPPPKPTFILYGANVFCFLSSLSLLHQATTAAVFGPYLSSLYSYLTLYRGFGLAYSYEGEVSWDPKRRRSWASWYLILVVRTESYPITNYVWKLFAFYRFSFRSGKHRLHCKDVLHSKDLSPFTFISYLFF
jgi:hypothetical protein